MPLRGNSPSGNPFSQGSPVRKHGGAVAQRLRGQCDNLRPAPSDLADARPPPPPRNPRQGRLGVGKIFKNQLTIPKSVLKYSRYCNAIRKRSSPRHHERRRDSESLRWDTLRATFVRPERSGRVLPIQSSQDAVTSAKQGGTAQIAPLCVKGGFFYLIEN